MLRVRDGLNYFPPFLPVLLLFYSAFLPIQLYTRMGQRQYRLIVTYIIEDMWRIIMILDSLHEL